MFAICSVLIATMCLQITKLGKLAQIALGGGSIKAKVADNLFCSKFAYIGHKVQNIDQFLCQRRFYRPFPASNPVYRPFLNQLVLEIDQKEQQSC